METTILSREEYLSRLSKLQLVPNWGNQTGLQFEVQGNAGVNYYSAQYSTLTGVSTDQGLTLQYTVGGLSAETEISNSGNIKQGGTFETLGGLEFEVNGVVAGSERGQLAYGVGRQIGPSFLNVSVSALVTSQGSETGNYDRRAFIDEDGVIHINAFNYNTPLGTTITSTTITPGLNGTATLRTYDPQPYMPSQYNLLMGGDGGTNSQDIFSVNAHCFVAGTPVLLANGLSKAIEEIAPNDLVAAFDERTAILGALGGGRVVSVFRGITDTLIQLNNGLVVTPGHHFVASDGGFRTIENILKAGGLIVAANGELSKVEGEYVRYSEATASLFEEAEGYALPVEGSAALAPEYRKGWRTYNFEVEGLPHLRGRRRASAQYVVLHREW